MRPEHPSKRRFRRAALVCGAALAGWAIHRARRARRERATPQAMPLAPGLPSEPYGYRVPVQADAPWPTFRRDERNTGRSPIAARYHGDRPWSFATGKGIFSTPVVDGRGTIYVGSADHNFYAIGPDGSEKWRFESGEVIDSAAALRPDPETGVATVVFPSGDGYLRCLRAEDGALLWALDARLAPQASYNNWFEGNVAVGYDGALYAGNTNFCYYAVNADGSLRWTYATGSNAWSCAAFCADGTIFWGACDARVRAVRPDGSEKWRRWTLGFVSASAAVGSDGTVYIGSFDSHFYALHPETGRVKWKFKTGDHIYGSAALGADAAGRTSAIYFGSTDGLFYALAPDGRRRWTFDAGAPIRSSPAVGRAAEGEEGDVVYFGCGNGRLYALNAADGSLRWSFDTTPDDPELRDRNDLNGSPALGQTGVYIGGEHGRLWYVPYDYPRHAAAGPAAPSPDADVAGMFYVTPGGNLHRDGVPQVSPATILTLRLVVRRSGQRVDARLYNAPLGRPADALQVRVEPDVPFRVETSADGRYLHIVPERFLAPDADYRVRVAGNYYHGGLSIGNLQLGGRKAGRFDTTLTVHTRPSGPALNRTLGRSPAFEWTRLAMPLPAMLPSLNQIGFDYMDWIVGVVQLGEPGPDGVGRAILWAVGGQRTADGRLAVDPASDFTLPLSGTYRDDAFILTNRRFNMEVTGIPIPFNLFQLRGQLGPDLCVRPGATAYADTQVLSIPTFGPLLVLGGLANNWWQKLLAAGTYVTRPWPLDDATVQRAAGLSLEAVRFVAPTRRRDGHLRATLALAPGSRCPLAEHRPGLLLVDAAHTEAVPLDYHANLRATADGQGNLRAISLDIPAGTALPDHLKLVVLLDVVPVAEYVLRSGPGTAPHASPTRSP